MDHCSDIDCVSTRAENEMGEDSGKDGVGVVVVEKRLAMMESTAAMWRQGRLHWYSALNQSQIQPL